MKFSLLLIMMTIVTACATPMTAPPFGVASENAWFLEQDSSNHLAWPMYCMSNVKDSKAHPKCYRATAVQQ